MPFTLLQSLGSLSLGIASGSCCPWPAAVAVAAAAYAGDLGLVKHSLSFTTNSNLMSHSSNKMSIILPRPLKNGSAAQIQKLSWDFQDEQSCVERPINPSDTEA